MTQAAEANVLELKRCPRCEESLPLSEFGVCRARKDGLNLYCKRCIRQKIALSRQALREYKDARRKSTVVLTKKSQDFKNSFPPHRMARMRKLAPGDRVREAIRSGARTQKEIVQLTKLPKDEVCDALANLLLWTREIRTQLVKHQRVYFLIEADAQNAEKKSKHALSPSFSSVGVLMPGRKPSAKGKKRVIPVAIVRKRKSG
jgi:hypothetical protein